MTTQTSSVFGGGFFSKDIFYVHLVLSVTVDFNLLSYVFIHVLFYLY